MSLLLEFCKATIHKERYVNHSDTCDRLWPIKMPSHQPITAGTESHPAAFDRANGYFHFCITPFNTISCDINDKSTHLTLPRGPNCIFP